MDNSELGLCFAHSLKLIFHFLLQWLIILWFVHKLLRWKWNNAESMFPFFKLILIQTRSLHLSHCHLRHSALLVSSRDYFKSNVRRAGLDFSDRVYIWSLIFQLFPTISFCNYNPLKLSVVSAGDQFILLIFVWAKAFVSPSSPRKWDVEKANVDKTEKRGISGNVYAPINQLMQEYQAAQTGTKSATNTYELQVRVIFN